MKKLFTSAALVAALLAAGSAPAQAFTGEFRTGSIHYGDLNLESAEGLATFKGRVRAAANALCADHVYVSPIQQAMADRSCRANVLRNAEAQVNLAGTAPQVRLAAVR
jgi:UrcA family protein